MAGDFNDVGDIFVRDRQASTTGVVSGAVVPSEAAGASNLLSLEAVSADGRFVVFESFTGNLVEDDDNRVEDIFVRDRQLGTVERVSVDSSGNQANGPSNRQFAISADGQHVAYQSDATNLVPIDTNGVGDVFVRDRQTSITERVSVASDGSEGDDQSGFASISGDGRYVAFNSDARNLVSADTNDFTDVFVRDRQTGITEWVSVNSSGVQGNSFSSEPSLSLDGRYVAFFSFASNLVPGDTNNRGHVFIRDRQTGVTERVSLTASDGQANGSESFHASISDDGRYVAFASEAGNLVPGDTNGTQDVFVRDRQAGTTERVSVDSSGGQVDNGNDTQPVISGDGRFVAFHSVAANLVPGDTNNSLDVFVHDRQTGLTERSSVDSNGAQANRASTFPSISANGRFVAFGSGATNLGADLNDTLDIYLHDRGGTAGTLVYSLKPASGTNFGEQPINSSSRRPFTMTRRAAPLP